MPRKNNRKIIHRKLKISIKPKQNKLYKGIYPGRAVAVADYYTKEVWQRGVKA